MVSLLSWDDLHSALLPLHSLGCIGTLHAWGKLPPTWPCIFPTVLYSSVLQEPQEGNAFLHRLFCFFRVIPYLWAFCPQWNSECPHPHCNHAGSYLPFGLPRSPLHPSLRAKRGNRTPGHPSAFIMERLWWFLMHCAVLIDFLFCLSRLTVCSSRVEVPHPLLNPHHDAWVWAHPLNASEAHTALTEVIDGPYPFTPLLCGVCWAIQMHIRKMICFMQLWLAYLLKPVLTYGKMIGIPSPSQSLSVMPCVNSHWWLVLIKVIRVDLEGPWCHM